jgi:hypothetical protein
MTWMSRGRCLTGEVLQRPSKNGRVGRRRAGAPAPDRHRDALPVDEDGRQPWSRAQQRLEQVGLDRAVTDQLRRLVRRAEGGTDRHEHLHVGSAGRGGTWPAAASAAPAAAEQEVACGIQPPLVGRALVEGGDRSAPGADPLQRDLCVRGRQAQQQQVDQAVLAAAVLHPPLVLGLATPGGRSLHVRLDHPAPEQLAQPRRRPCHAVLEVCTQPDQQPLPHMQAQGQRERRQLRHHDRGLLHRQRPVLEGSQSAGQLREPERVPQQPTRAPLGAAEQERELRHRRQRHADLEVRRVQVEDVPQQRGVRPTRTGDRALEAFLDLEQGRHVPLRPEHSLTDRHVKDASPDLRQYGG